MEDYRHLPISENCYALAKKIYQRCCRLSTLLRVSLLAPSAYVNYNLILLQLNIESMIILHCKESIIMQNKVIKKL